jgi:hypothetical protein
MVNATANLVRGHKVADVNVRKLGDAKQVDDFGQTRKSDAPMSNSPQCRIFTTVKRLV